MKGLMGRIAGGALAALIAIGGGAPAAHAAGKTLYLFNWQDYIGKGLIKKFEAYCGCKVVQTYYDSNSELEAKLRAGGDSQYDVVVPSSYYIPQLVQQGLIRKLDKAKLPNFKNLLPRFRNVSYDPHDAYVVPYQWGTIVIGYNKDKIKNPPDSWAALFDPKYNSGYPFSMMKGSGRDLIGAACAYLGEGFACKTKAAWIKAAKLIETQVKRSNFSGFVDGDPTMQQLKKGVVAMGMTWSGSVAQCYADKTCLNIGWILPKEGSEAWVDNMAIPTHAPDPELAYKFINFILGAKEGADLSNFNMYPSPNAASIPYLDKAIKQELVTPTPAQMKRLSFLPALTPAQAKEFGAIWTAVRQH
ncbi:spermidine/putrescine ABC transporter substrate-binding protein [Acidiphilium sp. C61]|uniref:polyamine ABC transporter substrate-binding protein n=1 Tax=Acidiphilium sp. C61 TaxID=1671485 RepID=UPI00157A47DA|nr:spermidine/putrescine ABC transporter substrate-binding protein [Acidiphilium sp. C61]